MEKPDDLSEQLRRESERAGKLDAMLKFAVGILISIAEGREGAADEARKGIDALVEMDGD